MKNTITEYLINNNINTTKQQRVELGCIISKIPIKKEYKRVKGHKRRCYDLDFLNSKKVNDIIINFLKDL